MYEALTGSTYTESSTDRAELLRRASARLGRLGMISLAGIFQLAVAVVGKSREADGTQAP